MLKSLKFVPSISEYNGLVLLMLCNKRKKLVNAVFNPLAFALSLFC